MIRMESILTLKTKGSQRKWCDPKVSVSQPPLWETFAPPHSFPDFLGWHQVLFCSITAFFIRESDKHLHAEMKVAINSLSGIAF